MCSSDEPGDGIRSNSGTSVRGRDAGFFLAFAAGGVGDVFAALDPPGRHLDHVALAEREMRAEPELADQHDLVALQIDRQDDDDPPDPHGVALERRAVQLHAIALVAIECRRRDSRARELDLDRGIGRDRHRCHRSQAYSARRTASGAASRLKAAANSARV